MSEPVTLTFIFQTIGVILAITALFVIIVNYKTKRVNAKFSQKKLKENQI